MLLIQVMVYFLLWLSYDYLAILISLIIGAVCLFVFAVAVIVELIESSRVPRWYFWLMGTSIVAPILAALIFVISGGTITWMEL